MSNLTNSPSWLALEEHFNKVQNIHLKDLFKDDNRFDEFSVGLNDILLDFSKNRITSETFKLLVDLAKETGVEVGIKAMFLGHEINITEKRSVLHTALRNRSNTPVIVNGKDVMPQINEVLNQMRLFTKKVRLIYHIQ